MYKSGKFLIKFVESIDRSLALVFCSGSGQPVEFLNVVLFMPNSRATEFIRSEKISSVPEIPSAKTIAASFPDWTITPLNKSETVTF